MKSSARKRRQALARWRKPARFDRNLIVIGGGAAGLVSAYIGAAVKARVTLVEAGHMGGDCLNTGCVPSKALIRSAALAHQMRHAGVWGLTSAPPEIRFRQVMARINAVIAEIAPHDSPARYAELGVEVLAGHATLIDPWTVEITADDGSVRRLTTRAIILATGAAPTPPDVPGIETAGYLTTDTMWAALSDRDQVPRRIVVLGGGPVGAELAQAFARLGSEVTLIEAGARVLAREDAEVSDLAQAALAADGVLVMTGRTPVACGVAGGVAGGDKWIEVEAEGIRSRIACDEIIAAVGRTPRLEGYGLEALGIPVNRVIETNDYLETLYPNILAAGDVAGPRQFTHVAAHQAWYAAVNALFGLVWRFKADYRVIPRCTFLSPEIGQVGLNEQEARAQGIAFEVTRHDLRDLDRAITDGATAGFVKVLTVPRRDRILGVTIVGDHAGDLLAEFVLAMTHGLGLNKLLGTIHIYPTLAEANRHAAGAWRRAHASRRMLRLLDRFHRWRRG
ncbi:MAG: FAD-dependent oxidoreductase [Paracoccaceae bacterium]|nr:FAD-dependent oxidoreductase [Paracoccaceae bacterium]